jgi:hypothetical protein
MLTESVLFAGIAGTVGLLLSLWAAPLLVSLKPSAVPLALNASADIRVLVFTLLASLATGMAFGLAPALHQSKLNQVENLKDGSPHGGSARSRPFAHLRLHWPRIQFSGITSPDTRRPRS